MPASLTGTSKPWYREPWPWFLMAGPAIVVVAAAVTLWLALASDDGLVAQDYYRRGLAINRVIGKVESSRSAGLAATMIVGERAVQIDVANLQGEPPTLTVTFRHPTRAGIDRVVEARRIGPGRYRAELEAPVPGRWLISLDAAQWRLRADAVIGGGDAVSLVP